MARIIIRAMKRQIALALAAIALVTLPAVAQGPRRDGRWEVKMEMEMAGMPAGMPAMTTTQCITPDEARDPQKAMPQGMTSGRGRGMNDNCKVSEYKVDGNKVNWSMRCEGAEPMTGTGEFTYTGDTYTGLIKMDRGGRAMTMKYSGKRLGDCDKK